MDNVENFKTINNQNQQKHQITISNFIENEIVTYPVILLKGKICSSECKQDEETGRQLLMINSIETTLGLNCTFKSLIKLSKGPNIISISYCCTIRKFSICYESRESIYKLRPLYVIFQNDAGHFQAPDNHQNDCAAALNKIDLNLELLQCVLAEKLFESKLGRRTFCLERCQTFLSRLSLEQVYSLSGAKLWEELAKEICASNIYSPHIKHVAFLSGTKYEGTLYKPGMKYEDLIGITKGYVALGAGGLAIFGTANLFTWSDQLEKVAVDFRNETKIDKSKFLDDSGYKGTWGACYSTTLGSVLHELCHTFDLGHAASGIMSRGFDSVREIFLDGNAVAMATDQRKGSHGITDSIVLHKSGCFILRYHKWFNDYAADASVLITYDASSGLLKSRNGLKVIEVRKGAEDLTVASFCFTVPKFQHRIEIHHSGDTLVAVDTKGNILKLSI